MLLEDFKGATAPYQLEKLLIRLASDLQPSESLESRVPQQLIVEELLDGSCAQLNSQIMCHLPYSLQNLTDSQMTRVLAELIKSAAAHSTHIVEDGRAFVAVLILLETCIRYQRIQYDYFTEQRKKLQATARSIFSNVVSPLTFNDLNITQQRAFLMAVCIAREIELFCAIYATVDAEVEDVRRQEHELTKDIWRGRWRVNADYDGFCAKLASRARLLRIRWRQEQQTAPLLSDDQLCVFEHIETLYLPSEECTPRAPNSKRPRVNILSRAEALTELLHIETLEDDSAKLLALTSLYSKEVHWPTDPTDSLVGVARQLTSALLLRTCMNAIKEQGVVQLTAMLSLCCAAMGPARSLRLLPVPLVRRVLLCCAVVATPSVLRSLAARPMADLIRVWANWLSSLVLTMEMLLIQSSDLILSPLRKMLEAAIDCDKAGVHADWLRLATTVEEALGRLAHRLASSERHGRLCKGVHIIAATYAQALTHHVSSDGNSQYAVRRAAQSVILTLLDAADTHLLQQTRFALKAAPKEILKQVQREHELFRHKGHV